ncbi:MAG TPA: 2-succinyl-6-hydroxy-2,4-cyclohexadiene-1-carboxylate synthase [Ktedonobacteraceae bacterium]|nr:2-succinyl-6-hydroxy-2,4-cyclohexadiene-1-carboxylate synthase [Ktedonobacteraceae bacterium]
MSSKRLLVNGVYMGVEERGEAEGAQGTLVLLHGFTGSSASWDTLLNEVAGMGWHVIAPDMLGHGASNAPAEPERYSIEHCQSDLLALLQQLAVKPGEAILLGYSMGGRIALYSAFSHYFRALILESASPGLADPQERALRRKNDRALAERIEREGVEAFINYWEKLPLFASQSNLPAEQWEAQRRKRLNNRAQGLANSLRGVGTGEQPALHERLADLNIPVLLLAGELDTKFCRIAQEMAAQLPQAELQIVPGAGHTIHLEQSKQFGQAVCTFCTTVLR